MNIPLTTAVAVAGILLSAPAASAAPAEVFRGDLVDLSSTTADPFGDASAHLVMTETGKGTRFHLRVKGIAKATAGTEYGAHLHIGPCVEGNGAAALGHYNASTATPPVVNNQTEVWLDFEVTEDGTGAGDALVPFVPVPGERSVVIHAEATAPSGAAGPRLVCLPVVW
ncbi:MAG: superoxide dismutase family protein [Cryobacterium sp.]|nr:superoxide dismutase family protein [Cryobacterium sp.]